jgi:hypothetical protein
MYWQPGIEARLDALEAAEAQIQADLAANYRLTVTTGSPMAPVAVAAATTVLVPLPAVQAAPKSWPVGIWTNTGGVIFATNDVAGVYEIGISLSFSDNAAAPTMWTWILAHGQNLATVPLIAERVSGPVQLSAISDPDNITLHGTFVIEETGNDLEFALFAAHNAGASLNVTIQTLQFNLYKAGTVDQV